MNLKDIFNSIGGAVGVLPKPISNYMPPVQAPIQYELKDRGVKLTEEDLKAIRPIIYGEVSNRDISKKQLEANVIMNTILNRMKEYATKGRPKSLSEVVSMPNQYQAYGGNQYNLYHNPADFLGAEKKKQVDSVMDTIDNQIRNGQYPDTTEGAFYYNHEPKTGKIYYDNKKKLFAS